MKPWEGKIKHEYIIATRAPTENDKPEHWMWIHVNDIQWIVYIFDNERWERK